MRYLSFEIRNYRAIEGPLEIDMERSNLIPLVGINECGKTTILQAIYCFDDTNDGEYEGKHLKDIKNLYQLKTKGYPLITAKIEIKYGEFVENYKDSVSAFNEEIDEKISKLDEDDDVDAISDLELQKISSDCPISKASFNGHVLIERNLETLKYRFLDLNLITNLSDKFQNDLSVNLISQLPYILYNDDFMDRPPNYVDIPKNYHSARSGWLAIYDRLFKSTSEDYSLDRLTKESDTRLVDSILSDVESTLNNTLAKAWKTFLLSKHGAITIKLKYLPLSNEKYSGRLEIKVVEKIDQRDRHFDVIDRSKGFLWFFNFVMKLEFNPKVITTNSRYTIYLLDEPGSYLHYSAQEKLCSKLVDISKKHGVVIFCTHSHTLLNPNEIPLNNIYVVEKGKSKKIAATLLPQVKTKIEATNAYQPILEALQISAFHYGKGDEKIIAVEGIYDKYSIELLLELNNILILPGTSANSIIKNIQFLNGFNKKYIAIWDNDEEGQRSYNDAKKFFGPIESNKFDLLPKGAKVKMRMEQMFDESDFSLMQNELGYDKNATYEKLISALYFSSNEKKKKILSLININTKENFAILKKIIEKRFENVEKIISGELIDTSEFNT